MKTFLVAIAALLFATVSTAQTIPALTNSNGFILTAVTRSVPPVNVVPYDELSGVTQLILLDEKSMKAETGFTVSSFSMTTITPSGNSTFESKGTALSSEMKSVLQKLKSGDKVYFEYIKGKFTDNTTRSFASMAFEIK